MPKLPSGADIQPQVAQNTRRVPNTGLAMGAAGQANRVAQATPSAFGEGLQDTAKVFYNVQQQIQSRDDAVSRARAIRQFSEESINELNRIQTEEDMGDRETATKYMEGLRTRQAAILDNHEGTPESRAALQSRLEQMRGQFDVQASSMRLQAQQAMVAGVMSDNVSRLSQQAYNNPGDIEAHFQSLAQSVDDMAGALTPDQEMAMLDAGRAEISMSALNSLIDNGQISAAQELMNNNPAITQSMSPTMMRNLQSKVVQFQQNEQRALLEYRQNVAVMENVFGKGKVPLWARVQAAGIQMPAQRAPTPEERINSMFNKGIITEEERDTALKKQIGLEKEEAKFQTEAGQYVSDRQKLVELYGKDSEQVSMFDENVGAKEMPTLSDEGRMRGEFERASKFFVTQHHAFGRVKASAQDPSPAGDLALIFNFMKVQDPQSVVRETEYETAAATAALWERAVAKFNKLRTGLKLSDAQRKDFVRRTEILMEQAVQNQIHLENEFGRVAAESGMKPSKVIIDYIDKLRPQGAESDNASATFLGGMDNTAKQTQKAQEPVFDVDINGNIVGTGP